MKLLKNTVEIDRRILGANRRDRLLSEKENHLTIIYYYAEWKNNSGYFKIVRAKNRKPVRVFELTKKEIDNVLDFQY